MGQVGRLSVATVAALIRAKEAVRVGDGSGLWLTVARSGAATWSLRFTSPVTGRVREMGLGAVTADLRAADLQAVRQHAADARRLLGAKIDPLEARPAELREAVAGHPAAAKASGPSFEDAATAYIKAHEIAWGSAKHAAQWRATLETYAYPTIRDLPVSEVGIDEVLTILQPIWAKVPETAGRVRGRIEAILDYAHARRWRGGENPARWKGSLASLLPSKSKLRPVQHHAAMPWAELPAFMRRLLAADGVAAQAVAFAVLTAARSGEVRGCTWSEIDFENRLWIVPAERMKAKQPHSVPLSGPALQILHGMRDRRDFDDGLVFPGMKRIEGRAQPLSDMSLSAVLRRLGRGEITVHGFRSSFRDWCGDATDYPRELAEAALAHSLGGKVEGAYRRETAIEKRRVVMEAWASYLLPPAASAGRVVALRHSLRV